MDKTNFNNSFAEEVWNTTYKFGNEKTVNDTFIRIAKALSSVEKDSETWMKKFQDVLSNFKFVPGGRIISNAGTNIAGTSLINCFVDNMLGYDIDSMESIMNAIKRQALILKSEGGYGTSFSVLRPNGAFVSGIANETPGAVAMMELWDKVSEVITKGSGKINDRIDSKKKIRKGAMMGVLDVWHPDIVEFVTAKQTPGRLSKFNISVGISDDFMHAVKNNLPWDLVFPDYENAKSEYKKYWNGNLKEWQKLGLPVKVYNTFTDANILWNLITTSTYNRNEPGILFIDRINHFNNLYYTENISCTNPCGEQPLPDAGVCLLGNINLTQYVDRKNKNYNWDLLKKDIPVIVRLMDNVNEMANVPLQKQEISLKEKRRIGLGVMGYASSLLLLGYRYGSPEALKITEDLMNFIANQAYQASAFLAKEKGSFILYDAEKYLNSNYLKILSEETRNIIKQNGMRNSHLLSIAPTGNTSAFANVVSGGLEPIFATSYYRTYIIPQAPQGLILPSQIDWVNRTGIHDGWSWISEGDDNLLMIEFEGTIYKYDKNRGLTKVALVEDYGYSLLTQEEKEASHVVVAHELTINEHIDTMIVFAKYMDAAVSKTINIPADFRFEDFQKVYLYAYDSGYVKGCTTYREGTMMNVLSTALQKVPLDNNATKRPKKLPCEVHQLIVKGEPWIVIVGLLENVPYEVFAFKRKNIKLNANFLKGELIKVKSGHYDLDLEFIVLENITSLFSQDEEEALTRMISMALRHNVKIEYIIEQLNKAEGTITSFSKAISRTLKKYLKEEEKLDQACPNCGATLVRTEACTKCTSCDYSVC